MRIGIIGLAGVGKNHLKTILQMTTVEAGALCDVNEELAHSLGALYNLPSFTSARQMLDPQVTGLEAVIIATPPATHAELTRLAAERGLHVLCETPMASTVTQCRAMIQVCDERAVVLMIAHRQRYAPALIRLRELTGDPDGQNGDGDRSGELGAIRFVMMRYPHPGFSEKPWTWQDEDGAGPLLDHLVHATDVLQWLCGDVVRVHAEGAHHFAERFAPAFNCAAVTLRFRSGAIGTLGGGFVSHAGMNLEDLFLACEEGVGTVSGAFDNPETLRWSLRRSPLQLREESRRADLFRAELEHFIGCAHRGMAVRTGGASAMKAVAVCRAAIESARTGQPVEIDRLEGDVEPATMESEKPESRAVQLVTSMEEPVAPETLN